LVVRAMIVDLMSLKKMRECIRIFGGHSLISFGQKATWE